MGARLFADRTVRLPLGSNLTPFLGSAAALGVELEMFVEYRNWQPPEPLPERPHPPKLTRRQEKVLMWAIALNVAMLFLAPLAGVTVLQGLWAWATR